MSSRITLEEKIKNEFERLKKYLKFKIKNLYWLKKNIKKMNLFELYLYIKFYEDKLEYPIITYYDYLLKNHLESKKYYKNDYYKNKDYEIAEDFEENILYSYVYLSLKGFKIDLKQIEKMNKKIIKNNIKKLDEILENDFEKIKEICLNFDYTIKKIHCNIVVHDKIKDIRFNEIPINIKISRFRFPNFEINGNIADSKFKIETGSHYYMRFPELKYENDFLILALYIILRLVKGKIKVKYNKYSEFFV